MVTAIGGSIPCAVHDFHLDGSEGGEDSDAGGRSQGIGTPKAREGLKAKTVRRGVGGAVGGRELTWRPPEGMGRNTQRRSQHGIVASTVDAEKAIRRDCVSSPSSTSPLPFVSMNMPHRSRYDTT